jgi:hypothetical protein
MARPIAKTPTLKGTDAKRFRESLLASLTPRLSASEIAQKKEELSAMEKSYKIIASASNDVFN